jgi:hypothetical protein
LPETFPTPDPSPEIQTGPSFTDSPDVDQA